MPLWQITILVQDLAEMRYDMENFCLKDRKTFCTSYLLDSTHDHSYLCIYACIHVCMYLCIYLFTWIGHVQQVAYSGSCFAFAITSSMLHAYLAEQQVMLSQTTATLYDSKWEAEAWRLFPFTFHKENVHTVVGPLVSPQEITFKSYCIDEVWNSYFRKKEGTKWFHQYFHHAYFQGRIIQYPFMSGTYFSYLEFYQWTKHGSVKLHCNGQKYK